MLKLPLRLWLCTKPADMRRSYDGLIALVKTQLALDPLSGQGFVFINRRRTQLKCVYFDQGGYCIWSKRLEQGEFATVRGDENGRYALTQTEFTALIEGLDLLIKRRRKRWRSDAA